MSSWPGIYPSARLAQAIFPAFLELAMPSCTWSCYHIDNPRSPYPGHLRSPYPGSCLVRFTGRDICERRL
jgi:hypothetical protein